MKRLLPLAFMACLSAHAEFRTGNKLLDEMKAENYFSNGVSLGYVMGVADAGSGSNHCPPPTVTAGQVSDMVKGTLESAPAIRHMPADSIIYYVLNKAWPCAKKGQAL